MDVIRVAGKVGFVAYLVFPISMLSDGLLAFPPSCFIGRTPERVRAMFGESSLDQAPAGREIGIVGRQSPDTVKVIRHHDNGVDFKRTQLANGSEGIAQDIDGFTRRQNGTAAIRYHGEEECAAGNDGASILHGRCRVTLR